MLNDKGFKVEVLRDGVAEDEASAELSREIVLGISEGMTCGGCASKAQRLLQETEGVESAEVSFEDKTAAVQVCLPQLCSGVRGQLIVIVRRVRINLGLTNPCSPKARRTLLH